MSREEKERVAIGALLRARREALKPHELGLPSRPRSRTPGLRREDVAELAGISESYYRWLEQGRIERPSERILRRVARALRLSEDEERALISQAMDFDAAAESYATIAAERLSAFLGQHAKRCWSVYSLGEIGRLWMDFIHHDRQSTFFARVREGVAMLADVRGPATERLDNVPHRITELGSHATALFHGEVLAVADLLKSENELFRMRAEQTGIRCLIEVAIRAGGLPVAIIGYAEQRPRVHSAIELHLMKSISAIIECGLTARFAARLCDLRRSLAS